jgi:uncharacterized protein with von Willebrand factor type A (vWA) domain
MFEGFFYELRSVGVPVSPTSFLRLQRALSAGLVADLDDFYAVTRALLVKSERQFDLYDRVFAHHFEGAELDPALLNELEADVEAMLRAWLADPEVLEGLPPDLRAAVKGMSPEELVQYFLDRLAEQKEAHHGGNKWIGTGGTSPVGHSGVHPGGMRVGGRSQGRSALKVALERRYADYADDRPLTMKQLGEALRSVRHLAPAGPRDHLNVDETIRQTVKQAGEIELVFDRRLLDKLEVFLFLDNGGWSMDPFLPLTRALFHSARDVFRRSRFFYFHNCVYDVVWEDPRRHQKPVRLADLLRADPATRVLFVGDASMAPWELTHRYGAIDPTTQQRRAGLRCLQDLAERFPKAVWVNPIPEARWTWSYGAETLQVVRRVFPMVELSLKGLEAAVELLKPGAPR